MGANFGRRGAKADFQKLKDLGVELAGKIALVQYGGMNRGVKIKNAEVGRPKKSKYQFADICVGKRHDRHDHLH